MVTIISFVIVLGVLIFIHELGHFAVAKMSGVGVEKFSLGFGPKIIGVKSGETEYLISALPLGGYVKMVGEAPGEDVPPEEKARSFASKSVLTKASIVAAGPIMNLVLAFALLPVIFMIGIQVPAYLEKPAVVGYVVPDEAAYRAGIRKGDTITSVDGKPVKNWESLLTVLSSNGTRTLKLGIARDSGALAVSLPPASSKKDGVDYAGLYPQMPPVIGEVSKDYPAMQAGMLPGDLILSIDGVKVTHWAELESIIHKDGTKKIFLVQREHRTVSLEITPRLNKEMNVYLVGISRKEEQITRRYGFFAAISKGASASVDMTSRLFLVIKGLVVGQYSLKTLGGPIMIAQVAGKAAAAGIVDLLSLVAFLSLQLGIINLFPVPVLDGGHILFFGIEFVKGSPLSEKFMSVAQQVGIALLVGLMLLVTYNDIFRIIGRM